MIALTQENSESNSIDIVGQVGHTIAFQISDSDDVITLIAGALSHQTIRVLSAEIEGIAGYKGLDMVVDNCCKNSDGIYQILTSSALT